MVVAKAQMRYLVRLNMVAAQKKSQDTRRRLSVVALVLLEERQVRVALLSLQQASVEGSSGRLARTFPGTGRGYRRKE